MVVDSSLLRSPTPVVSNIMGGQSRRFDRRWTNYHHPHDQNKHSRCPRCKSLLVQRFIPTKEQNVLEESDSFEDELQETVRRKRLEYSLAATTADSFDEELIETARRKRLEYAAATAAKATDESSSSSSNKLGALLSTMVCSATNDTTNNVISPIHKGGLPPPSETTTTTGIPTCGESATATATMIPLLSFWNKKNDKDKTKEEKKQKKKKNLADFGTTTLPFCPNCQAFVVRETRTREQQTALTDLADQVATTFSSTTSSESNSSSTLPTKKKRVPKASSIFVQLSCDSASSVIPGGVETEEHDTNKLSFASSELSDTLLAAAAAANATENETSMAKDTTINQTTSSSSSVLEKVMELKDGLQCNTTGSLNNNSSSSERMKQMVQEIASPQRASALMKHMQNMTPKANAFSCKEEQLEEEDPSLLDATRNRLSRRMSRIYTTDENEDDDSDVEEVYNDHPYQNDYHGQQQQQQNNKPTPRVNNRGGGGGEEQRQAGTFDFGTTEQIGDVSSQDSMKVINDDESWESGVGSLCSITSIAPPSILGNNKKLDCSSPAPQRNTSIPEAVQQSLDDAKQQLHQRMEQMTESLLECSNDDDHNEAGQKKMDDFNTRQNIAAKAIGQKLTQGYRITEILCPSCGMPFLEAPLDQQLECVTCPAIMLHALEQSQVAAAAREQQPQGSNNTTTPSKPGTTTSLVSSQHSKEQHKTPKNSNSNAPSTKQKDYENDGYQCHFGGFPSAAEDEDNDDDKSSVRGSNETSKVNKDEARSDREDIRGGERQVPTNDGEGVIRRNKDDGIQQPQCNPTTMISETIMESFGSRSLSGSSSKEDTNPTIKKSKIDGSSSNSTTSDEEMSHSSSLYFSASGDGEGGKHRNTFLIPSDAKVKLHEMYQSRKQRKNANGGAAIVCGSCGSRDLRSYEEGRMLCLSCFNTFRLITPLQKKKNTKGGDSATTKSSRQQQRLRHSTGTATSIDQRREQATQRMCRLLEDGWEITSKHCKTCLMPIMFGGEQGLQGEVCVSCDDIIVPTTTISERSTTTATATGAKASTVSSSSLSLLSSTTRQGTKQQQQSTSTKSTSFYDHEVGDKLLDGWALGTSGRKCVCGKPMMRPPASEEETCISESCPFSHLGGGGASTTTTTSAPTRPGITSTNTPYSYLLEEGRPKTTTHKRTTLAATTRNNRSFDRRRSDYHQHPTKVSHHHPLPLNTGPLEYTDDLLVALDRIERPGPKTAPAPIRGGRRSSMNDEISSSSFSFEESDLLEIQELTAATLDRFARARKGGGETRGQQQQRRSKSTTTTPLRNTSKKMRSSSSNSRSKATMRRPPAAAAVGESKNLEEQLAMAAYLESFMSNE